MGTEPLLVEILQRYKVRFLPLLVHRLLLQCLLLRWPSLLQQHGAQRGITGGACSPLVTLRL